MRENIEADQGDSTLLSTYLEVFLQNAALASEQDTGVLLYRGHPKRYPSLIPSVFRDGLLNEEHKLIHELLLKTPEEFSKNPVERLIKMQHYGLPTRLLDFTTNPLVALYFACVSDENDDGEILVLYDYVERIDAPRVVVTAALAECPVPTAKGMIGFLRDRGTFHYEPNPMTGRSPELEKVLAESFIPLAVPLNNERIKRQHGAHVLSGICGPDQAENYQKNNFDLKPFLLEKGKGIEIEIEISVPKDDKPELLSALDAIGINRAFLFPELEHQARYVKEKCGEM